MPMESSRSLDVVDTKSLTVSSVENIRTALEAGDIATARSLMAKALDNDVHTKQELADEVVDFAEKRILMGDTLNADHAIYGVVHEGVAPHMVFNAIKAMARKPKGA